VLATADESVLWLAHREELLAQAKEELLAAGVPEAEIGMLSGRRKENERARVLIASVAMLRRKPIPRVGLIVLDEAHHVTAKSYLRIRRAHPDVPVLGLTATAQRLDGQPLGLAFNHLFEIAGPTELQADGFLLKSIVYSIPAKQSRALRTGLSDSGGGRDYSLVKLEKAMMKATLMGDCVSEYQRLAGGTRALVYACTRAHGRALLERFQAAGVAAAYIDGETPAAERRELLGRSGKLERGEILVVVNVGVLTEGFNCPPVSCIIVARPTKSFALWRQMCGRGARPFGDKLYRVLDHAGNIWRHRFPDQEVEWSLDGEPRFKGAPAPMKRCDACGCMADIGADSCSECGAPFAVKARRTTERQGQLERADPNADERSVRERILRNLAVARGLGEDWVSSALAKGA
jgi:superfamily II DNA or RNA helicase